MTANPVREGTERPGSAVANPVRPDPLVLALLRPAPRPAVAELVAVMDSGETLVLSLGAGAPADLVAQGARILRDRVQAEADVPSDSKGRPRSGPS
jgi:hypothetical protein